MCPACSLEQELLALDIFTGQGHCVHEFLGHSLKEVSDFCGAPLYVVKVHILSIGTTIILVEVELLIYPDINPGF